MAKAKTTVDATSEIPNLDDNEVRRELLGRRQLLMQRIDALNARQAEIEGLLRDQTLSKQSSSIERLLADPEAPIELKSELGAEHMKVQNDAALLKQALKALDEQIQIQQCEVEAWACGVCRPTHRRNVRAMLNAQLTLHRSIVQQRTLFQGLTNRGYQRLGHLPVHWHGDFTSGLEDPNSWLSSDLREAHSQGFITEEERVNLSRGELEYLDEKA